MPISGTRVARKRRRGMNDQTSMGEGSDCAIGHDNRLDNHNERAAEKKKRARCPRISSAGIQLLDWLGTLAVRWPGGSPQREMARRAALFGHRFLVRGERPNYRYASFASAAEFYRRALPMLPANDWVVHEVFEESLPVRAALDLDERAPFAFATADALLDAAKRQFARFLHSDHCQVTSIGRNSDDGDDGDSNDGIVASVTKIDCNDHTAKTIPICYRVCSAHGPTKRSFHVVLPQYHFEGPAQLHACLRGFFRWLSGHGEHALARAVDAQVGRPGGSLRLPLSGKGVQCERRLRPLGLAHGERSDPHVLAQFCATGFEAGAKDPRPHFRCRWVGSETSKEHDGRNADTGNRNSSRPVLTRDRMVVGSPSPLIADQSNLAAIIAMVRAHYHGDEVFRDIKVSADGHLVSFVRPGSAQRLGTCPSGARHQSNNFFVRIVPRTGAVVYHCHSKRPGCVPRVIGHLNMPAESDQ